MDPRYLKDENTNSFPWGGGYVPDVSIVQGGHKAVVTPEGKLQVVTDIQTVTVSNLDITDRAGRALGKVSAEDGALATIGAIADAAVTDPALTASAIALLKGMLTKLADPSTETTLAALKTAIDTLNSKIDALDTSVDAVKTAVDTAADGTVVSINGSIPLLSTDVKPTMAADYRGNCYETDTLKVFSWSGSDWVEVA